MGEANGRVKVLYISGSRRSGTTVLAKALGELQDTFAAGELRLIWQRSYVNNEPCGCGAAFSDCELWQDVTTSAFGESEKVDAQWMIANQPQARYLPFMLLPGGKRLLARRFRQYIAAIDRLYQAVATRTGSRVIVDSSKELIYGYVLRLLPSIDLYVVHLVRDPHGVQYSRLRRMQQGDPRFDHYSVTKSSLIWNVTNVLRELVGLQSRGRYLRVRYEEFASDPLAVVQRIVDFLDEPDLGAPRVADGHILLHTNHTVAGSENRADSGKIPLRLDDRWQNEMSRRDRATVTRLTFPLLHHYGYR